MPAPAVPVRARDRGGRGRARWLSAAHARPSRFCQPLPAESCAAAAAGAGAGLAAFAANSQETKQTQDNTPPPGFKALFNGKDIEDWVGATEDPKKVAAMSPEERAARDVKMKEGVHDHWKVKDGVLISDGNQTQGDVWRELPMDKVIVMRWLNRCVRPLKNAAL